MKKVIKAVYINDKKADGTAYIDKNGSQFKMAVAQFEGDQNKYSMYIGKYGQKDLETIQTWQAGMEVEVLTEQSGQFYNFRIPTKTDVLEYRVNSMENFVRQICLLNGLKTKSDSQVASSYQSAPEQGLNGQIEASQEITMSDIPF